jgi:hypothetical protein
MARSRGIVRRSKPVPHPLRAVFATRQSEDSGDDSEEEFDAAVGDPSQHARCVMFRQEQFTDFKISCGGNEWNVHKCVLFFASSGFETLFSNEWKTFRSGNFDIPGKNISKPAFDSFLLFLYTGLVSGDNLNEHLFELYDLSTHFEVKALKNACLQELYDSLSTNNAETYLSHISTRTHDLHLATMCAASLTDELSELLRTNFQFHKIGKTMLPLVFKRLGEIEDHYSRHDYTISDRRLKDPENLGNPETHYQYRMFKEGNYSDFQLNWNGNNYSLHRCVLSTESLYFHTFFNSEWKESNSGQVNLPEETSISSEAFELFLVYCYTRLITKENLVNFFFELRALSDYFQV